MLMHTGWNTAGIMYWLEARGNGILKLMQALGKGGLENSGITRREIWNGNRK